MVAIIIAGWFVSPVITKLINSCFEYLEDQISCQPGMKKVLERLEVNHPKIQSVVNHVTEAKIGDPALNKWLWQLRDAIDEADDLLDEIEYMNYKKQVAKNSEETNVLSVAKSSLFETALNFGKDPILKRLEEVVQKLDEVSNEVGTFLHLVDKTKQEQQYDLHKTRETGPSPSDDLIGRSKEKKFVLQWLRQPSNEETGLYRNISLLSIVGHGGMGKTTLLQHVYEDEEIAKEFDLKMWICVSNNFDAKKVIADMLEYLKKERPRVETIGTLQENLKSEVRSKKFLLILDDIWGEEEQDKSKWEVVLAPLACGKLGSKILVTSRMDSVATMITKVIKKKKETLPLQGLEEDECLQLLNAHAFAGEENPDDHKKLRSITAEIAKKLSRSPLAAKVIGGALNSHLDERYWFTVLNSDFKSTQFGQIDILPILRLSYTFLPRPLQNCFAFCSIFPQDHEFDKDDLVRMWIALDFIQSSANQEETFEDIGGRYFDILVKKSFFDKFQSYPRTSYKMHDLLHELAQFISAQECFRVVRDKELHFRIPETIRHLSIDTKNLEILKKIEKFKRLRSLFLHAYVSNEEIVDALTKIFESLRSIRLLYIDCFSQILIPEAIGNLIHLRYLNFYLESTKKTPSPLPSSLCNLYHLQFIIQKERDVFCNKYPLPRDMNNLLNLRYFKMPWKPAEINGIGKLRSLQNLDVFYVKNEVGYSIQELEHMNELRHLRIKLLENVKDAEQACKAKLCGKRNLTDLTLEWGRKTLRNIVNLDLDERVLDNLQPYNSLKKLRINSFMGVRSPIWLNNADLLSNLECIQLDTCLEWQTLPPFGKLPFLKSLYLINMPKAKSNDYNYHRNEKDCVFPSLELLSIEKLDALEDWFDATTTEDCLFPCLTKLRLKHCPNLKELSCLPPKLKSMYINNIKWKTLSCRSISKSIPLEELYIFSCPNITCISLAEYITRLAAFRELTIDRCPNLISLGGHQEVETTENCQLTLIKLWISNSSMLLMEPLKSIASLKKLDICNNDELVFLSETEQWFRQVSSSISELFIGCLKSLRSLPSFLESLSSLKILQIDYVPQLQLLPNFPASLEKLDLQNLESLLYLPSSLSTISSLKNLEIINVPLLQQLPDLPSLKNLNLKNLESLQCLPSSLPSLKSLNLKNLESLQCLPSSLSTISSLKSLWIKEVPLLQQLPDLPSFLEILCLRELESLQCLPSSLSNISSLKKLEIENVPLLQQLPDLPSSLKYLSINGCHEELKNRYDKISGFDRDKLDHIPQVYIE